MWRRAVQAVSLFALNPFGLNFFRGAIYTGPLKSVCAPGFNCYSCPAAWGACPIGSLQVILSGARGYFEGALSATAAWTALYVAGFIGAIGAVGGRFACGWICPFGLLQELLYARKGRRSRLPRWSRQVKYVFLAVLVIAVPLLTPYPHSPEFCKRICPAGTLEAGIPLVLYDRITGAGVFEVGFLFAWKVGLLAVFLAGIVLVSRFFCRTSCPLGASWSLFNRVSLVALEVDAGKCVRCGQCRTACPMDVSVFEDSGSPECIRCLKCVGNCPQSAVRTVVRLGGSGRGGRRGAWDGEKA